jgi:hypothetical protein
LLSDYSQPKSNLMGLFPLKPAKVRFCDRFHFPACTARLRLFWGYFIVDIENSNGVLSG